MLFILFSLEAGPVNLPHFFIAGEFAVGTGGGRRTFAFFHVSVIYLVYVSARAGTGQSQVFVI